VSDGAIVRTPRVITSATVVMCELLEDWPCGRSTQSSAGLVWRYRRSRKLA
jgi:hypothetical protein